MEQHNHYTSPFTVISQHDNSVAELATNPSSYQPCNKETHSSVLILRWIRELVFLECQTLSTHLKTMSVSWNKALYRCWQKYILMALLIIHHHALNTAIFRTAREDKSI